MSAAPLVSVIVPLHDHADVVGEALESILAQSHRPIEVIVVDDGSTDGGGEVVAQFGAPVRLVRQARAGAPSARNRGAALAQGELLAFLDADDLMAPGRLVRQSRRLTEDPSLDGVFGDVVVFRGGSGGLRSVPRPARLPGCILLRRTAWEAMEPVSEEMTTGDVIELVARADEAGLRLVHQPGGALERRLHAGNHGHTADLSGYARVLRGVLARRRASEGQ